VSINLIDGIEQIYVDNFADRWLVAANNNYYRWNNFNQSYQLVNAPSFPPFSYIYQNSSLGTYSQGKLNPSGLPLYRTWLL
jgi:hypothetical protein